MNIAAVQQPLPRSTVPTLTGKALSMYRGTVQTVQEAVRKSRTYYGLTDGAAVSDVEITTPFSVVTSGFALRVSDGVYIAITVLPKSTNNAIAVISGLAQSTAYLITIYGR